MDIIVVPGNRSIAMVLYWVRHAILPSALVGLVADEAERVP